MLPVGPRIGPLRRGLAWAASRTKRALRSGSGPQREFFVDHTFEHLEGLRA